MYFLFLEQTTMKDISLSARIIGSFFYSPLTNENNKAAIEALFNDYINLDEPFQSFITEVRGASKDALDQDFCLLFEGAGIMPAPPWGSVYLNRDNILFGESTANYYQFLQENSLELDTGMQEPVDQFGLMLLAISQLLEVNTDESIVKTLIGIHLFPWCFRYLELLEQHAETKTYKQLARLTYAWCSDIKDTFAIETEPNTLYY